uniref:Truncated methyltransferase-like 9 protein n=1 Tax=Rattus norvegicus TaxID=10116 RepID=C3VPW1_RAT|nr:truncated methyltransferase-like 9 protein [Rattus norvegicus]
MRLLAGWLCLSLASVWLARRMWTLRSPLSRSLYVNMTSGPGGPAAATGGGKDTHQFMCATERNYANHFSLSLFRVILTKEHRSS